MRASATVVTEPRHQHAREHGIDTLGVSWGYAPAGELGAAGAVVVIDDVADLASSCLELLR
jgi:phosphoglycolate phosphatase